MKVNIPLLQEVYFAFDKPVDYQLKNGVWIKIYPVLMDEAMNFLMSQDILMIEKNQSNSIEIIQMSYLRYMKEFLLKDQTNQMKFGVLLSLCLKSDSFKFGIEDTTGKLYLVDVNNEEVFIGEKDFDNIKKIILYQNLLHYDDTYLSPDLKQAMAEVDELRNRQNVPPNMERKMAIITSHTGMPKHEQMKMTLRSHSLLFEEVCGEIEYMALKPIAIYGGKGSEVQWINKKAQGKYDGYFTSDEKYSRSMGGDGHIKIAQTSNSSDMMNSYTNFNH